jgi:hypothetical protein
MKEMKMSIAKRRRKNGRDSPPFARLEKDMLLNCSGWKDLSPSAKLLYMYIKAKYNGSNNGEIKLSYSELSGVKGISSSRTISKAQLELTTKEWIEITTHGGMYRYSNLYKLTWRFDNLT